MTSSGGSPTAASTRTRWSPWAPPSRRALLKGEVGEVLLLDVAPLTSASKHGRREETYHQAEHDNPRPPARSPSRPRRITSPRQVHVLQGERGMSATTRPRPVQAGWHPAGAAQNPQGPGDLPYRRERHRERLHSGQGHRPRAQNHHPGRHRPLAGRDRAHEAATPSRTPRRTASAARRSRCATRPTRSPTPPRRWSRESGEKIPADIRAEIDTEVRTLRESLANNASAETLQASVTRLTDALQRAGQAVYAQEAPRGRPRRRLRRRRHAHHRTAKRRRKRAPWRASTGRYSPPSFTKSKAGLESGKRPGRTPRFLLCTTRTHQLSSGYADNRLHPR